MLKFTFKNTLLYFLSQRVYIDCWTQGGWLPGSHPWCLPHWPPNCCHQTGRAVESWAEREDNVLDIEWNLNLSYLSFKRCSSSDKPTFCNVVFASKRWKSFFVWFSVDVHLHDDKGNDRRLVSQTNAGCIMMQAMNIFLTADKKNRNIVQVRACKSVSQRTTHVFPLDGWLVEMSMCEESSD